ncbi:MAG: fumarylacetoacetate hydrolase family protein [Pseudomonadota bacterium]
MTLDISPHKIRNLWCIGRNYAAHAEELGNKVPDSPLVFLKAGSTVQASDSEIVFPDWATDIQHELELALQWDDQLKISRACLALDFTERSLQASLREKGQPWTLAKSFSGATAITPFFEFSSLKEFEGFEMSLLLDDELKQKANINEMIFGLQTMIDHIEKHFPICPGDLLLTGTPAGVGPIKSGQTLSVSCNRGVSGTWKISQPQMRPNE